MNQIPEVPELRIVRSADLQPHESIDQGRSHRLIRSLRNEGFLKNPPVVLPLSQDPERYLVLDGANRTTAFQEMGFPHMLVQVAHSGVEVRSWNHALMGGELAALVQAIRGLGEVAIQEMDQAQAAGLLAEGDGLAYLAAPDGSVLRVDAQGRSIEAQVELLGQIVGLGSELYRSERTSESDLEGLTAVYPDLTCLVVYRHFSVDDVVEVVTKGALFPSGLTRFLVSPRALRLNFPIAMLADRSSLDSKKKALAEWIRRRMEQQHVRYYAESTFLFDE